MHHLRITLLAALSLSFVGHSVWGQVIPSPRDTTWRYNTWMETAGLASPGALVFSSVETPVTNDTGPWATGKAPGSMFRINPAEVGLVWNSAYPSGFNMGGIPEGTGVTAWSRWGATADAGWIRARLGLAAWGAENANFTLGPSGLATQPLASVDGASIDTPQRFGTGSYAKARLDNTEVSLHFEVAQLSAGNENFTFGPAVFDPLMLSSNAAGIPHVRLGMDPVDTAAGRFEAQLLYGKLTTSDFWKDDPRGADRFFGGLFLGYQPAFFSELTLGAGRTIISNWNQWKGSEALALFGTDSTNKSGSLGSGVSHQHAALTYRLRFPSVGFETYGEWAKNDYSNPIERYWLNPDHMQAYTLGLKKTFVLPWQGVLGVGAEATVLSQSKESLINYNGYGYGGDFYSGWATPFGAGYTNEGMVLGGGIGNGSEAQFLYADAYFPNWHFGLELRRIAQDVTGLYVPTGLGIIKPAEERNAVEVQLGLQTDYQWNGWLIGLNLAQAENWNRYQVAYTQIMNYRVEVKIGCLL